MATAAQFNLTRAVMTVGQHTVGRVLLSCVHSSVFGAQENDMTDNSCFGGVSVLFAELLGGKGDAQS